MVGSYNLILTLSSNPNLALLSSSSLSFSFENNGFVWNCNCNRDQWRRKNSSEICDLGFFFFFLLIIDDSICELWNCSRLCDFTDHTIIIMILVLFMSISMTYQIWIVLYIWDHKITRFHDFDNHCHAEERNTPSLPTLKFNWTES